MERHRARLKQRVAEVRGNEYARTYENIRYKKENGNSCTSHVVQRNIIPSSASLTAGEAARNTIDADVIGHLLGELNVFHIRARLASSSISGVVTGHAAGVDTAAMRTVTVFSEVAVGLAAHALGENNAILRSMVRLLTPDALLRNRRIWCVLHLLHLHTKFRVS